MNKQNLLYKSQIDALAKDKDKMLHDIGELNKENSQLRKINQESNNDNSKKLMQAED